MNKQKVVFITGASRGIGLATAKKFASSGWLVAGFYLNSSGPEIEGVTYFQLDISNLSLVKEAFKKAHDHFGRADCLVNNAGITMYKKSLTEYDEDSIDKMIGVNEKGMYFCSQVILEYMKEGSIINMSSSTAHVGGSDPLYTATKAAALGFTKSMAKSLAPSIRVNAVAPGATDTDMMRNYDEVRRNQLKEATLDKRLGEPEDVANAIYFLASNQAGHITGICLDVTGGYVMR